MAITYRQVNGQCQLTLYRNGEVIGQHIHVKLLPFSSKTTKALLGVRYTIRGRTLPPNRACWIKADIEEVQIYNRALSQVEIQSLDYMK